jgi:hypothetical protein
MLDRPGISRARKRAEAGALGLPFTKPNSFGFFPRVMDKQVLRCAQDDRVVTVFTLGSGQVLCRGMALAMPK